MGSIPTIWTPSVTTEADSGDNTVIAAPGAGKALEFKRIVVQNETATATTVLVKAGTTIHYRRLLGERETLELEFGTQSDDCDVWRLPADTAFVVNLSATNSHGVSADYRTADV